MFKVFRIDAGIGSGDFSRSFSFGLLGNKYSYMFRGAVGLGHSIAFNIWQPIAFKLKCSQSEIFVIRKLKVHVDRPMLFRRMSFDVYFS